MQLLELCSVVVMLRVLRRISLKLYPKVLGYSIVIGGGAIGAHQYMKRQTKSLEVAVYKNMEKGSKPPMSTKNLIPREDIEEKIKIFFSRLQKSGEPRNRQAWIWDNGRSNGIRQNYTRFEVV